MKTLKRFQIEAATRDSENPDASYDYYFGLWESLVERLNRINKPDTTWGMSEIMISEIEHIIKTMSRNGYKVD